MGITIASRRVRVLERESFRGRIGKSLVRDEGKIYEELILPRESQMTRTIWRVVRHPELAEDTLQDALMTIWRRRRRIRRHPNPHALILKICLNTACDALRKRRRWLKQQDPSLQNRLLRPSVTDAARDLERKKMEDEILEAISRLPRKQALAVLMRIVQDQPYNVIGDALGCSDITARVHVSKARARLSQWLSHLSSTPLQEESK